MERESKEKIVEKENKVNEKINSKIIYTLDENSHFAESLFLNDNDLDNNEKAKESGLDFDPTNKHHNINECPKINKIDNASKLKNNDSLNIKNQKDFNFRRSLQDENSKKNQIQNRIATVDSFYNGLDNDSKNVSRDYFFFSENKNNNLNNQKYEEKRNQNIPNIRNNSVAYLYDKRKSINDSMKENVNASIKKENFPIDSSDIPIYDHNILRNRKSINIQNFSRPSENKINQNKNPGSVRMIKKQQEKANPEVDKNEITKEIKKQAEKQKIKNSKCSFFFKFILMPFIFLIFTFLILRNDSFQAREYLNDIINIIREKIYNFRLENNSAKFELIKDYIKEASFLKTDYEYTLNSITDDFRIDTFNFKEIAKNLANLRRSSKKDYSRTINEIAFYLIKREYQLSDFSEQLKRSLKSSEAVKSIYNPSFILINIFENSKFNLQRKLNYLIASRNPIPLYYPSISFDDYNKVLNLKIKEKAQKNANSLDQEIYKNFDAKILQYKLNKDFYYFLDSNKKNFLSFSISETINNEDPLCLINDIFKSKFDVFSELQEQLIFGKAVFFYTDYDTMNEETKKNFNIAYCYGKNEIFKYNNGGQNDNKTKNVCLNLINKFDFIFITVNQKDLIKTETTKKIRNLLETYLNKNFKIIFLVNSEIQDIKKNSNSKDLGTRNDDKINTIDLNFTENFSDLFIEDEDSITDISKDVSEKIMKIKQAENVFYINFHKTKSNSDDLRDFLFSKIIKSDSDNNNNNNTNNNRNLNEKKIFKIKKKQLADFLNSFQDQSERNTNNNYNKKKIERSEELVKKMLFGVKTLIMQKKDILDYTTDYFSIYPIFRSIKEIEALRKQTNKEDVNAVLEERYHKLKKIYESKFANENNLYGKAYKDFINFLESSLKLDDLDFNVSLLSKKLQAMIKSKIIDPINTEKNKNPVNYNEENGTGVLEKKQRDEKLDRKLALNSLSIEYFWREAMLHYEILKKNNNKNNNAKKESEFSIFFKSYKNLISYGEPFEILDGDNNYIYKDFILKALDDKQSKKIFKILMVGQQNTGKSTLLNMLFGTVFKASDGRCTKGIYGSFIASKYQAHDYTLILDTEGLDSFEKADKEYDHIFTLFSLSLTDAVVINVKDQLTKNFEGIISNAAKNIKELKMHKKTPLRMFLVFNQKQDHKNAKIQYAETMKTLVKNFNNENIKNVVNLDAKDSLFVLPLAYDTERIEIKTDSNALAGKSTAAKASRNFINWNIYINKEDFLTESNSLKINLLDFSTAYVQKQNENDLLFRNFILKANVDHEQLNEFKSLASSLEYSKRIGYEKLERIVNDLILKHFSDKQKIKLKENFLAFESKLNKNFDDVKNSLITNINKINSNIKELLINHCDLIECDLTNRDKILNQLDRRANSIYEAWSNEFFIDGLIAEMNNEKDNKLIEIQNLIIYKYLMNKTFTEDLAYKEYDESVQKIKADLDQNYNNTNIISSALKYTNVFYSLFTKTNPLVFSSYLKFEKVKSQKDYELLYDSVLMKLLEKNALFSEYNNQEDKYVIDNSFSLKYALKEFVFLNKTAISNIYLACNESFGEKVKKIDFKSKKISSLAEFMEFNKELEKDGLCIDKSEYNLNTGDFFVPKIKDLEILECKISANFLKKFLNVLFYFNPFKAEDNSAYNFDFNENKNENDITYKILKFIKTKLFQAVGAEKNQENKENYNVDMNIKEIFEVKIIFNEVKNIVNNQTENYVKFRKGMIPIDLFNIISSEIENEIFEQINSELKIFKLEITTLFKQKIQRFALKLLLKIAAEKLTMQVKEIKNEFSKKANKLRKEFISQIYNIAYADNYTSMVFLENLNEYYSALYQHVDADIKNDLYQKNNVHVKLSSNSIIKSTHDFFLNEKIKNQKEKQDLMHTMSNYVKDPVNHIISVFEGKYERMTKKLKEDYIKGIFNNLKLLNFAIHEVLKGFKEILSHYNPKPNALSKEKFSSEKLIQIINSPKSGDKANLEKSLKHFRGNALINFFFNILSNTQTDSNMIYNRDFIFSVDSDFENFIKNKFSIEKLVSNKSLLNTVKDAFLALKQLIKKKESLSINNLFDFISKLLANFEKHGFTESAIKSKIELIFKVIKDDLHKKICKSTCPLCGAPCDHAHIEQMSIGKDGNMHKCQNGHFFAAFKGLKFETNGEGVVKKCSKFKEDDVLVWKGSSIKWKNFLQQSLNAWEIPFQEDSEATKAEAQPDIVKQIWKEMGPEICKKQHMKFVLENTLRPSEYFFTFILDNSGSMTPYVPALNKSFRATLIFIENLMKNARMNLILFNSASEILVENQTINAAYADLVTQCKKGCLTDYSEAFKSATNIVRKYKSNNKHFIVFFTDGAPTSQDHMNHVKNLKSQLGNVDLNKFVSIYFGSAYQEEAVALNEINNYLNGKIFRPADVAELENVFQVEIPRIILPDNFENLDGK